MEALESADILVVAYLIKLNTLFDKPVDIATRGLDVASPELGVGTVVGEFEFLLDNLAHRNSLDTSFLLHGATKTEHALRAKSVATEDAELLD